MPLCFGHENQVIFKEFGHHKSRINYVKPSQNRVKTVETFTREINIGTIVWRHVGIPPEIPDFNWRALQYVNYIKQIVAVTFVQQRAFYAVLNSIWLLDSVDQRVKIRKVHALKMAGNTTCFVLKARVKNIYRTANSYVCFVFILQSYVNMSHSSTLMSHSSTLC